jgi:hypothetical protein
MDILWPLLILHCHRHGRLSRLTILEGHSHSRVPVWAILNLLSIQGSRLRPSHTRPMSHPSFWARTQTQRGSRHAMQMDLRIYRHQLHLPNKTTSLFSPTRLLHHQLLVLRRSRTMVTVHSFLSGNQTRLRYGGILRTWAFRLSRLAPKCLIPSLPANHCLGRDPMLKTRNLRWRQHVSYGPLLSLLILLPCDAPQLPRS